MAARASAEPVTQTRSVCPGPEALGVEHLPKAPPQTVTVAAASAPVASLPAGSDTGQGAGSLTISGLPSGGRWPAPVTVRGQVLTAQLTAARSTLVTGAGAMAPGTVASQWSWAGTGKGRGLVAAPCMPGAASSWLLAGGAAPGRLERLVLTNPGSNPVTVDLSLYGVNGPIVSPDGQSVVVAGSSRTVILLDAIAGSERSPMVHVGARGGKVAATLSDTWLDGVVPRGGDDVVSATEPSREQVIAGVPTNGRAFLRLAVPGRREAVVESRVLTPAGPRPLPEGGVTRVAGRSTRDIDLRALPPGAYALQVRADVPVLAAVMLERRRPDGGPSDLAWSGAAMALTTLAGMVLPAPDVKGVLHRLDLAATRDPATVRLTTVGPGGRIGTKQVAVGADSAVTLPLEAARSVWVTPLTGRVRAAVRTSVNDVRGVLLSLTPLTDLTLTTTPTPLRQLPD